MDPLHQLCQQILQSLNPIHFSLPLIFFLFLTISFKLKPKHKTTIKSPPSPPKLPIIGNLHQLGSLPHRSLAALSQKHGPIMLLNLGQTPTLIISSPNLAKQALKSQDLTFSNRAQNRASKTLLYNCKDVAFASYGEQWRQARKLCVLELLSAKRVESFHHIRDQEIEVLVKRVLEAEHSVINLTRLLMSTSNNIVSRCVLGGKSEGENGFGELARKVMVLLSGFCVGDAFAWLWWVDVLRGFCGELKRTFEKLDGFLDRVIEEHREKGFCDDFEMDFVDILLRLQREDALNCRFTVDDFKAIVLDMFLGGTDTTATGLEWTMTELIRNPTTMNKVQQEIRTIVGKKQNIETTDIEKMEYMNCVIKESLRLHPPVPLLLPRQTPSSNTINFEGYQIPPKTNVWINVWAIQRDPTIWERPNEFIPERFMDKNSVDFKGQDFEFLPFGSGRRKCIGMSFAIASFECILANLLYWFDWELSGELDMSEQHGLSVFKKVPLNLIPIPRFV